MVAAAIGVAAAAVVALLAVLEVAALAVVVLAEAGKTKSKNKKTARRVICPPILTADIRQPILIFTTCQLLKVILNG